MSNIPESKKKKKSTQIIPTNKSARKRRNSKSVKQKAAWNLVKEGYSVFPCFGIDGTKCSCGKEDCSSPGKHPITKNGFKDASNDLNHVSDWWQEFPDANIGLLTGKGFFVLDVDAQHNGPATLKKLEKEHSELPNTVTVDTGGGGQHYYFKCSKDDIGNKVSVAKGLDIRGNGGYVIVPPSSHSSGNGYGWRKDKSVFVREITEAPDWLINLIKQDQLPANSISNQVFHEEIPKGCRNSNLTRIAGAANRHGCNEDEIFLLLVKVNTDRCSPPLSEQEVARISRSVARYPSACGVLSSHNSLLSQKKLIFPVSNLYGPLGDFVHKSEQYTEADPVAVYVQLLTLCANAIGPRPHIKLGNVPQQARLYSIIVGNTSRARKGTSFGVARTLMQHVDAEYCEKCIVGGASTGEGLINAFGAITKDSRLCLFEPELASILSRMKREGNTLSEILRQGYDCNSLSVLTRKQPLKVNNIHLGMIGHITGEELQRQINDIEIFNGFGNRFLWLSASRSKNLPNGAWLPEEFIASLGRRIRDSIEVAKSIDEVVLDREAEVRWEEIYNKIVNTETTGVIGAITARGETIVLRLALVFALLDGQSVVTVEHFDAAFALWNYSSECVARIFGNHFVDSIDNRILSLVSSKPITRTQLTKGLGGHRSKLEIDASLQRLQSHGLIEIESRKTSGRKVQVILAKEAK